MKNDIIRVSYSFFLFCFHFSIKFYSLMFREFSYSDCFFFIFMIYSILKWKASVTQQFPNSLTLSFCPTLYCCEHSHEGIFLFCSFFFIVQFIFLILFFHLYFRVVLSLKHNRHPQAVGTLGDCLLLVYQASPVGKQQT